MNNQVLRSKKVKTIQNVPQVKLTGLFNVSGTRPAKSGEEPFMLVEIQGMGLGSWVRVTRNLPRVEGASALILQGRNAKTKTGKYAIQPIALLSVEIDGEVVWEGEPVEDDRNDETQDKPAQDAQAPTPAKPAAGRAA